MRGVSKMIYAVTKQLHDSGRFVLSTASDLEIWSLISFNWESFLSSKAPHQLLVNNDWKIGKRHQQKLSLSLSRTPPSEVGFIIVKVSKKFSKKVLKKVLKKSTQHFSHFFEYSKKCSKNYFCWILLTKLLRKVLKKG